MSSYEMNILRNGLESEQFQWTIFMYEQDKPAIGVSIISVHKWWPAPKFGLFGIHVSSQLYWLVNKQIIYGTPNK